MVVFEVSGILKDQHVIFPANNFLKWGDDAGQSKKDRRFRHEGLEHRRCAKDVFCPCAPLRVFSNESGPSCETTVFYSTVLYFCKRLVGLSGIVYVNFPLSIIGFKIFLVIYVRFLYPR